ncbi:hypothetical protein SAMD00019534_007380 [Acytostelium subglobosum LB1]|uniref:hypothetical protein n=1 Tax=Acytostelium subglobosum LB1 TaxID=1410327 RepID=UPI000644BF9B|nr:hypothetical protein SAMD00019534_007380 [Acytostelium subglobosum LB1]GAM17563.1 hypothetical protein SAMD00019534_007380 [Acytostelium subglobosum LB1]|eukprot:XP_012759625.1 hypothetical protein SAMD00019534_007380 [Acytostelium subglobosum LB1]
MDNSDRLSVAQKLEQREEERAREKKKQHLLKQERQLDQSASQKIADTLLQINSLSNDIIEQLSQVEKLKALPKDQLDAVFSNTQEGILLIKQLFNETSIMLPQYEIKNVTEIIGRLESKLLETKNALAPKQKFSFVKKARKTESDQPATTTTSTTTSAHHQEEHIVVDSKPTINIESISNLKGQTIQFPLDALTSNDDTPVINDLTVSNLVECKLNITTTLTSLKVDNITGPSTIHSTIDIDGSIFIDNCTNTTFYLSARQVNKDTQL